MHARFQAEALWKRAREDGTLAYFVPLCPQRCDMCTPVAGQLTKHARAGRPGIPGVVHVDYRFILLLLGSVARVDGSPVTGALEVFRGVWQSAWISAALTKLAELGLFSQTYASLEAMLLSAARLAARQAVYPAEFVFGAADWSSGRLWYPRQRRAHVFTICDACFSFSFHGNLGVKDDHWTNPLEFPVTRPKG